MAESFAYNRRFHKHSVFSEAFLLSVLHRCIQHRLDDGAALLINLVNHVHRIVNVLARDCVRTYHKLVR